MAETGTEKQVGTDSVPNGSLSARPVGVNSTETNEPKKEKTSRLLSEGIILVAITAAAYVATYAYEFGYAFQFNIPSELITVSIQNLVYFGAMMIGFLLLFAQHIRMLVKLSEPVDEAKLVTIYQFFIYKYGGIITVGIIVMLVSRWHWITLIILVPVCLFAVKDLWHPRLSPGPSRREAIIRCLKYEGKDHWQPVDPQAQKVSGYVFLAVVTVAFFGLIGFGEARGRSFFPFLGDTNEAILRRYGDVLVIGRFDPQSGNLLNEFRVVKADELKERIVVRHIGSVWPVTVNWQDVKALHPPGANKQEPALPATPAAPAPDTHKAATPDTHKAPEPDTHKAATPDTHKPTNLAPKVAKPVPNSNKSGSATTAKPKQ